MRKNKMISNSESDAVQRISEMFNPTKKGESVVKEEPVLAVEISTEVQPVEGEEEELFDVDGEKISWKELVASRMRQKDYTTKTQRLSEERKALESSKSELQSHLADAKYILEAELEELNSDEMKEMKESNPNRYWKEVEKLQNKVKKFERLKERDLSEQSAKEQEKLQAELDKLMQSVPEWNDKENFKKDQKELMSVLESCGFDEGEMNSIKDHRVILLAKKAMQYDKLMNAKPDIKKVPVQGKVNIDGSTSKMSSDLKDTVRKTGKTVDAIAAISELLSKKK